MRKTLQERANECIAQECTTYSKRYDQYIDGIYPTHIKRTKEYGQYVVCNNNKKYYDMGGLGSNLFSSYNNYSLPCVEEVLVAEKIKKIVPFIEVMKFLKTGSAACEMAVRFCRAFTGRNMIFFQGYHGTHDTFVSHEDTSLGCIGKEYSQKFNTIPDIIDMLVDMVKKECIMPAAVIIEPVIFDYSEKHKYTITKLVTMCENLKIPIVFNEIITGFRFRSYCVANDLGVKPDLICFGGALADGLPLAVLAGRKDILNNRGVFCSNTHNGEKSALKRALHVLNCVEIDNINEMWFHGEFSISKFNEASKEIFGDSGETLSLYGIQCRFTLSGKDDVVGIMCQELCKKGYLVGKSIFPKLCDDYWFYRMFVFCCIEIMKKIANGEVLLEGALPRSEKK